MKIEELDAVELKDGRVVTVVHVYGNGEVFEVEDNSLTDSGDYDGDMTFSVQKQDIARVAWRISEHQ